MSGSRAGAFALLALAMLFWAGNWVIGRALRDAFDPVALNFWRWAIPLALLAPFALPALRGKGAVVRRHAGYLLLLGTTGMALFHCLVYLGLHSTTAVNGVLLNSSGPLFILLAAWLMEGERGNLRQVGGMLVSLAGILVILSRGDFGQLARLELRIGDLWILLAMSAWGVYSVLLRHRPPGLGGVALLFLSACAALLLLTPLYAVDLWLHPPRVPSLAEAGGVLYVALFASIASYLCWNRGVAVVGASAAGFTLHLLPVFGTLLAIAV
ncbi:MAG TPA: DMT family transporter, partial [Burkholderiales bacterium]|nr:DMT family transporter [Burkholderiales bacterium]